VLRLHRPADYRERGFPSNASPRRATPLVLAGWASEGLR